MRCIISSWPAYNIFITQRDYSCFECLILRAMGLSNRDIIERLISSLLKFYGRYGIFITQYEDPLSWMLHDNLKHDHSDTLLWSDLTLNRRLVTELDLITTWFFYFYQRFPSNTSDACQQKKLTPLGTWSRPTFGLACDGTQLSQTCLVSGRLSFEHPSVLLFCLKTSRVIVSEATSSFWPWSLIYWALEI